MNQSAHFDVAIVGGGLAGLTAASFAARAGRSVIVLEKAPVAGGRASTRNADGFYFNQGPHALYRGGRAVEILRELGVGYEGARASYEGSWVRYHDAYHPMPGTPEAVLNSPLFSPGSAREVAGVLGGFGAPVPPEFDSMSVREWLAGFQHEETRAFLEGFIRLSTYCADSDAQSAGAALRQTALGRAGVDYLDGGWQRLVESLRRTAEAAGARVEARHSVTAVDANGGEEIAIRFGSDAPILAKSVILTVAPATAAQMVNGGTVASLAEWAASAKPVYAACLDVGLKRLPRPEHQFAIGLDQPLYYSVHTRSARLAPPEAAVVQLAKYLGPDEAGPAGKIESELEAMMDSLQPGWRAEVATKHFLPRMLVTNAVVTAARGGTLGRPGPKVPEVSNLFIAGDWVGSEGMLADASMASAREAAALVVTRTRPRGELTAT